MGLPGGIELLDENDMILDPCHAGTKRRFIIIKEAKKLGVKKIVITHPNWNVTKATRKQIAEIGKMGAYIGLFIYRDVPNFNKPNCDPMEMFEIIKKVRPEHIVLASDLVTVVNVSP